MINMACDRALFCNCSTINDYTSDINVHFKSSISFIHNEFVCCNVNPIHKMTGKYLLGGINSSGGKSKFTVF